MSLEDALAEHFPRLDRDRGQHYYEDGRVELTSVEPERVEARVRCSREFTVEIQWSDNGSTPDFSCGCPFARASGRCKHLWAAILAASEASSSFTGDGAEDSSADAKSDSASLYDPATPLLFVVVPSPGHPERSGSIEFYQPTEAVDDRSAEVKAVRVKREQLRDVKDAFDRSLLDRLFGVPDTNNSIPLPRSDRESAALRIECSSYPLATERSHDFAKILADTQRLYAFEARSGQAKRLHWAPDRTYVFGVRIGEPRRPGEYRVMGFLDDGERRVDLLDVVAVSPSGVCVVEDHIAPFDPRGNFDTIGKTVGPDGPSHGEEDIGGIISKWVEDVCEPLVQLPDDWTIEEEISPPNPVLLFRQSDLDTFRLEGVNVRVLYDYDGRRIPSATGGKLLCKPDEYRVIRRDLDAEQKYWERLRALDLVTLDTGQYTHRVEQRSFSNVIERLVAESWVVEARERPVSAGGELELQLNTDDDGFALDGALKYEGFRIAVVDLFAALQKGDRFVELPDGRSGLIPSAWLRRLRILQSLSQKVEGSIRFRTSQGWMLDALLSDDPEVKLDAGFEIVRKRLEQFKGVSPLEEPEDFGGELREYQRDALGWLSFLREFGLGGCLADDMGLGKTVQVLAHLDRLKNLGELGGPVLVVCPNSVVYNWLEEAQRFVPSMKTAGYTGSGRAEIRENFDDYDIVVTTYGVMRRDVSKLKNFEFDTLVLDEAQGIKNSTSQTAKAARQLNGKYRLALSGTPIENRLLDLWSIFEYLNPGMLGSSTALKRMIGRKSAASTIGEETREFLARALRPFLLRRTKQQVAKELPEKTELTLYCEMDESQRRIYRDLAKHYRSTLLKQVDETGIQTTRMHVLEALLRLRQAACHPALVDSAHADVASCKLDSLVPQLEEIRAEGHKALVFSQFTTFLKIVRKAFDEAEIPYEYLDGQTRDRRARVERFQNDPDCSVFLISLKAGGLGLNLTAAEYVYILDPWWNPAVEAQAIDRAHRIGQTQKVFAYRLICKDTVEERILDLQQSKRELADAIVRADSGVLSDLSRSDLEQLLS